MNIDDRLSDSETVKFWKRYFELDYNFNDKVPVTIEEFCDAVFKEFGDTLIAETAEACFRDDQEGLDEDQLFKDLVDELRLKICIDDENVSINALELFTRSSSKQGLSENLKPILNSCCLKQKTQRSTQINDQIVSELSELKAMLDQKSKQLQSKEKQLKKKEQQFEVDKRKWAKKIE